MDEEASARLADAEVALGSTEANLSHIVATYGDAHATVAGNLSGDASFLDSGGGSLGRSSAVAGRPEFPRSAHFRVTPSPRSRLMQPTFTATPPTAISGARQGGAQRAACRVGPRVEDLLRRARHPPRVQRAGAGG